MTLLLERHRQRQAALNWRDVMNDFLKKRISLKEEPLISKEDWVGLPCLDPSGSMSAEFNQTTDLVINDLLVKAGFVLP